MLEVQSSMSYEMRGGIELPFPEIYLSLVPVSTDCIQRTTVQDLQIELAAVAHTSLKIQVRLIPTSHVPKILHLPSCGCTSYCFVNTHRNFAAVCLVVESSIPQYHADATFFNDRVP
jgi:hypothetical protein